MERSDPQEENMESPDFKLVNLKKKSSLLEDNKRLKSIINGIVNGYCIICQKPANLQCCTNHNYCSSICKLMDKSEHDEDCPCIFRQDKTIQHPRCILCRLPAFFHCCSNNFYCSTTCTLIDNSEHDSDCPGIFPEDETIQHPRVRI
ncbi:hypothetical protein TNIN_261 [Trichonephila inaurata madagascariensis]|uniref:MYND-type domain-containing protein n=1 Tax=Trichonephila inaurata madagascariensis TaxID=2747483 RepID=A0A8X6YX21_9ARAC|nr:hypothetical protein TNIN_261 [Trichonephila inaurata madagascariensis]